MLSLSKAILAFPGSDDQFRKYIQYREPLKEPLPPVKWWSRGMRRLREFHPKSSTYELSTKLKAKWYSMSDEKQERIRKMYTKRAQRRSGGDAGDFERYLQGVVILGGEGVIDEFSDESIAVAIVHDGSGYNPGAVIYVDWTNDNPDAALQNAFDVMQEYQFEHNRDYLEDIMEDLMKERREKYAEELAAGMMTEEEVRQEIYDSGEDTARFEETWDGKAWVLPSHVIAEIIRGDKYASEYISIVDEGE